MPEFQAYQEWFLSGAMNLLPFELDYEESF